MATTYKTPGVYIEEISKFPPSIAEVATAIPAFIGYTQKAVKGGIDYLKLLAKSAEVADKIIPLQKAFDAAQEKLTAATTAAENSAEGKAAKAAKDAAKEANKTAQATKKESDRMQADPTATTEQKDAAKKAATDAQTAADAANATAKTAQDTLDNADVGKALIAAKKAVEDADQPLKKAKAEADDAKFLPVPIRITSLLEYKKFFGTTQNEKGITVTVTSEDITAEIAKLPQHNMYYSMQAYFANGGGPCYIVPVGGLDRTVSQADLQLGLEAIRKEDEVTLIVFPESLSLIDLRKLVGDENNQNLAYGEYKALYDAALEQCNDLQDRFVIMDSLLDPATFDKKIKDFSVIEAANVFRTCGIGINNSKYGAAYAPQLETIFNYLYDAKEVNVTIYRNRKDELVLQDDPVFGEPVDPKNSNGPKFEPLQQTLFQLGPNHKGTPDDPFPLKFGELFPFIISAIDRMPLILPAAPVMAGVYASVDNDRGVWKAPANVSLNSVIQPTIKITHEDQQNLNVDTTGKSINAIRAFTGKGTLVWGARTLAGNSNEWRYISVRRFFIMAEESIKKGTEPFVFEPNDANTWMNVRAMIENFLILQWRAGALQGAKPEQSFYVKVGLNETMTALDILEGRLIIEIGMAVVRPAEFIILKFSHKMVES